MQLVTSSETLGMIELYIRPSKVVLALEVPLQNLGAKLPTFSIENT